MKVEKNAVVLAPESCESKQNWLSYDFLWENMFWWWWWWWSQVCWHFMLCSQLGARHPLFVHVDMLGASSLPPIFPSCRHFSHLYHHQYTLVVPPSSHPRLVSQQVMGPAAAWHPRRQLLEPSRDRHTFPSPFFGHTNFLGTREFFRPRKSSKIVHTFFYHLTTIAARLADLFSPRFSPFLSFSYAVLARCPLVCRFHTVHCWFHPSSPVSFRFLLFAYSSCRFHPGSPFS